MKQAILIFILLLTAMTAVCEEQNLSLGTELDAMPFINQGFYSSLYVGHSAYKFRIVTAQMTLPDMVVKEGFKDQQLHAYALILDYYPWSKDFRKGLWIGTGFEYWKSEIKAKNSNEKKDFDQWIYTLGAGYNIPVYKHLYINPWLAGHLNLNWDQKVQFSDKQLKLDNFTPELSVKLGIYF